MTDNRLTALAELAQIDKDKLERIYNLAKIDVLSEIKTDTINWLGKWAIIIAVTSAVLGAFGINEMIANRITTKVSNELANIRKNIDDARVQIKRDSELIGSQLAQTTELEKEFRTKIEQIEPRVEKLSELTAVADTQLALYNLIASFYTIDDVAIRVQVDYSLSTEELAQRNVLKHIQQATINNIAFMRKGEDIAQFSKIAGSEVGMNAHGVAYRLELYPPYWDKLNGVPIQTLTVDAIRFYDGSNNEKLLDDIAELRRFVRSVRVQILVNGVSILEEDVNKLVFANTAVPQKYERGRT